MFSISNFGRILMTIGILFIVAGGIFYFLDRFFIGKWKIPGDLKFEWGSFTFVIALGTSILFSVLLTIGLNLLIRLLNR